MGASPISDANITVLTEYLVGQMETETGDRAQEALSSLEDGCFKPCADYLIEQIERALDFLKNTPGSMMADFEEIVTDRELACKVMEKQIRLLALSFAAEQLSPAQH